MAVALVTQNIEATGGAVASRNVTIDLPTVGDLLLMTVTTTNSTGETSAVSGGGVTTWAELKKSAFSSYHQAIWWGVVDGTPGTTVTVTFSGSTKTCAINISQFTGAASWAADANTGTATATSTSKGSGTATPTAAGTNLHICVAQHNDGDAPSAGPTDGFTALTQAKITSGGGTNNTNNSAYRIDTGAATAGNPIWTIASQTWEGAHGIIVATLPAGGVSTSTGVFRNFRG